MKTGCLRYTQRILCGVLFLVLFVFGAVPAHALTSGTKTSGFLTPGATQTYHISASAGQGIMLFG